jgi:hypothetical protein
MASATSAAAWDTAGVTSAPASNALTALVWYATRQMPQIARGDVRGLDERAPAEQRLEKARRLVDPQLDVLDVAAAKPDRHGRLALDASR